MTIGESLKKIRKEKGFTQAALAKRLNITTSMIGQYETGKRNPKIDTLQKIAGALGVSLDVLIPSDYMEIKLNELLISNPPTPHQWRLLTAFNSLNDTGKEKAVVYTEDLTRIDEYRRQSVTAEYTLDKLDES